MNREEERLREEYQPVFVKSLVKSDVAVMRFERSMRFLGYETYRPPLSITPSWSEWKNHIDSGDLWAKRGLPDWRRWEVKHLRPRFTSSETWPHTPHFIVTSKNSFDQSNPPPHATVIMNQQMTHVAVVKTETRDRWYVQKRGHKFYPKLPWKEYYFAPLDCVEFWVLPDVDDPPA